MRFNRAIHVASSGHVAGFPVADLVQVSRDVGHGGKVSVVTCGVATQMAEVQAALLDAITSGNWLLIQNAHLAEPWTQKMLRLVTVSTLSDTCHIYPYVCVWG